MMLSSDAIISHDGESSLRIGIGLAHDEEKVMKSVRASSRFGEIVVYRDAGSMCKDLRSGAIDAAVRGDLPSDQAMSSLKEAFDIRTTQRVAILEPLRGGVFLLAPVGIDEGTRPDEREAMAISGSELMRRLGGRGRIGMMSAGRESDIGRDPQVDKSIEEAMAITESLRSKGLEADHVQITIESALDDHDVIVAPDGIIGNIIFRTLHFLGGAKALGAPVVNIDRVFIDTSRAKEDYCDSIALAYRLIKEARL